MKRIEEKIKEIEKKDKRNGIKYIGFIIIIVAFIAYAIFSEQAKKKMGETIIGQDVTIKGQDVTISEQNKKLVEQNDSLKEVVERLNKSQTPIGFWNETNDAKNTATYINYIMHSGKPEAKDEYKATAIEKIQLPETEGNTVWLFCGRKNGDQINQDKVSEVIYRKDANPDRNSVPQKYDIVENTKEPLYTYRNFSNGNTSGKNNADKAWPKNSKALVLDVKISGTAVFIQIKF
jgi:hypothetical protein